MLDLKKVCGALLVALALQFLAAMLYAESIYPNYSSSENFISDLGVGPTAAIFNSSAIIAGVGAIGAALLLFLAFKKWLFAALLGLAGFGILGVGLFPEGSGLHGVFAATAFIFGAISAIASSRFASAPLSHAFVALGGISLIATTLFSFEITLGLGIGGMERAIVYPFLLWAALFGATLFLQKRE